MLGDLLGHEEGQIVVRRVIPGEHGLPPSVETTYQASGEILGVQVRDMGSYTGRMRSDGRLYGQGAGILTTPSGDHASWIGHGVGTFGADGTISWRGSIIYESDSSAFAGLASAAGVYEWQQDPSGKVGGQVWAWK
ncbi:hypothetical protein GCM10010193_66960 [Kitasatospora atroaurantiaca]|uniref:Uncharacterized protein n=1 Tax=Kitasatospora atroaurantiaca TaxID=285545 RepID=A0A561EW00_9ACTN|nr:hypothetical protein [Kitasatospora atroaurantiaca]TWE19787.1 hypothetical protein FB465_4919 [Kitasatospora atroaurantiaca]